MKKRMKSIALLLTACIVMSNNAFISYAEELDTTTQEILEDQVEDAEGPTEEEDVSEDDTLEELPEEVSEDTTIQEEVPLSEEEVSNEDETPVTSFNILASAEEMNAFLSTTVEANTRLLVFTDEASIDFNHALACVYFDGLYVLTYENAELAMQAKTAYEQSGFVVEVDYQVENHQEEDITEDVASGEVETPLPDTTVEDIAAKTEKEVKKDKIPVENEVVVAVIDTGVNTDDPLLENRLSDKTNTSMADENGHGTVVSEIIASTTGENVKILPIAAFDKDGHSTVGKVYLAIEEAIAANANVINISASGLGSSKALEYAIEDAKNADIAVIVAAGNDGKETKDYMPANIQDAITVSAVDENKAFAEYSNYGPEVDFCAIDTLIKDMGTEDTSDDLVYRGTSVSCAYVSAYAALLYSNDKEVDIYESFKQSATDLGDEGFDDYYGYGYLSKGKIITVIKQQRKEKESASEEDREKALDEEKDMSLQTARSIRSFTNDTLIYGDINGNLSVWPSRISSWSLQHVSYDGDKLHISDGYTTGQEVYGIRGGLIHIGTYTPDAASGTEMVNLARTEGIDTGQVSLSEADPGYGYQVNDLTMSNVVFEKPVECHTHTWVTFNNCEFYGGISINLLRPNSVITFNNCVFYKGCGGQYSQKASCIATHEYGTIICDGCTFLDKDKGFDKNNGSVKPTAIGIYPNNGESLAQGSCCNINIKNCTSETSYGLVTNLVGGNKIDVTPASANISIENSVIKYATANPGVSLYGGGNATITDSVFRENDIPLVNYNGNLTVKSMTSSENSVGVANYHTGRIETGTFINNTVNILNGNWEITTAGITERKCNGTLTINACTTSGGQAGIKNTGSDAKLIVDGGSNRAVVCSGSTNGIVNTDGGEATITGVACTRNSNNGILNSNGTMTVENAGCSNNDNAGIGNDSGTIKNETTRIPNIIINGAVCNNNKIGIYNYSNYYNTALVNPGVMRIQNLTANNNTTGLQNSSYTYIDNISLSNKVTNIDNIVLTEKSGQSTGTLYLEKNGTLSGGSNSIVNSGNLYLAGGKITGASCGLVNNGNASIYGGLIEGNTRAIYQNGSGFSRTNAIDIYGDAVVNGNVYLTSGHYINIPSQLNKISQMAIDLADTDKDVSRSLVYTYSNATDELKNFSLAFASVKDTHKQTILNKDGTATIATSGTPVSAAIRAGQATNAPVNEIILSGAYYAVYKTSVNGVDIDFPIKSTLHYWNEYPNTDNKMYETGLTSNVPKVLVKKNDGTTVDVSKTIVFKGWSLTQDGSSGIVNTDQMLVKANDFDWYAIFDVNLQLYFEGNKQYVENMRHDSGVVNFVGEDFVLPNANLNTVIPANDGPDGTERAHFKAERVYTGSWYDANLDENIDYNLPYAWCGWSLKPDGSNAFDPRKNDANTFASVMGVSDSSASVARIIEWIKDGTLTTENQMAAARLYAVYNEYPVIKAYDIYITKADIPATDWLKDVTATDREDGTLTNGTQVIVYNMSSSDPTDIGDKGEFTITYEATDKDGNKSYYTVTVHVTSNDTQTSLEKDESGSDKKVADYIRFIDETNYNKTSKTSGGLEKNSAWKKEEDYVEVITQTFANVHNNTPVYTYVYHQDDINEMKEYTNANYASSLDDGYQSTFYTKFCRTHME